MKNEEYESAWPEEAGDPEELPREIQPPDALESRVVSALSRRELLRSHPSTRHTNVLAVAAAAALLGIGFLLGRGFGPDASGVDTGQRDPDLYALLLYETETYVQPRGADANALYDDYSRWVAQASEREQFITGEDFDTDEGWTLTGANGASVTEPGVSVREGAVLSGMFVVRAPAPVDALSIAELLPHLRLGGTVVVQRVRSTDSPPTQDEP